MPVNFGAPVRYLRGVGEAKGKLLEKLGIETIKDLLEYYPTRYEDRSQVALIAELHAGNVQSVFARVLKTECKNIRTGLNVLNVIVADGSARMSLVFFNQKYRERHFVCGSMVSAYGRIERNRFGLFMNNPEYEVCQPEENDEQFNQGIVPVYRLCEGLHGNYLRKAIGAALDSVEMRGELPGGMEKEFRLISYPAAIRKIHQPVTLADIDAARKRLIFDEFTVVQSCVLLHRKRNKARQTGIVFDNDLLAEKLKLRLPFSLTASQCEVWSEIKSDLKKNTPMERLVQGDVGSGKTAVSALALAFAAGSGYQSTLMAPTELLATQHYNSLRQWFDQIGISCQLLTGKSGNRKKLLSDIETGETDVVIGTHALIQERVAFGRLGLVITDEQHRFGVEQRNILKQKGDNPHMLVMTATPIPRTLALSLFGDMDISTIKGLPPGRKPVRTYLRSAEKRDAIYGFAKTQIAAGRQVFVVCPLIEESAKLQAQSAVSLFEELGSNQFAGLNCSLLHGQMSAAEKDTVMQRFVNGETAAIVSTTVIEVGIDVPNANMIIIEGAERFGLSQLHQLRGRVGRGKHDSYCVLLGGNTNPNTLKRLQAFCECNDGFAIADLDLQFRGAGQIFGLRQHGMSDLKIGDMLADYEIMLECKRFVQQYLDRHENAAKILLEYVRGKIDSLPELLKN